MPQKLRKRSSPKRFYIPIILCVYCTIITIVAISDSQLLTIHWNTGYNSPLHISIGPFHACVTNAHGDACTLVDSECQANVMINETEYTYPLFATSASCPQWKGLRPWFTCSAALACVSSFLGLLASHRPRISLLLAIINTLCGLLAGFVSLGLTYAIQQSEYEYYHEILHSTAQVDVFFGSGFWLLISYNIVMFFAALTYFLILRISYPHASHEDELAEILDDVVHGTPSPKLSHRMLHTQETTAYMVPVSPITEIEDDEDLEETDPFTAEIQTSAREIPLLHPTELPDADLHEPAILY